MALDPGRPVAASASAAAPAAGTAGAYAVMTDVLELCSGRARSAAATTEELAEAPALLAGAADRAGSPALASAASGFADAWSRECALLTRETRLLADALAMAAEQYRSTEWAAASTFSTALRRVSEQ